MECVSFYSFCKNVKCKKRTCIAGIGLSQCKKSLKRCRIYITLFIFLYMLTLNNATKNRHKLRGESAFGKRKPCIILFDKHTNFNFIFKTSPLNWSGFLLSDYKLEYWTDTEDKIVVSDEGKGVDVTLPCNIRHMNTQKKPGNSKRTVILLVPLVLRVLLVLPSHAKSAELTGIWTGL